MSDVLGDDLEKHTIPAGATDGSVLWLRLDNVPVMGQIVVLQRRKALAEVRHWIVAEGIFEVGAEWI